MRKFLLLILFLTGSTVCFTQIIDHNCTDLSAVPPEYITAARNSLHIAYGHTSHGSQVTEGMRGLISFRGESFAWNDGGTGGALDLHDWAMPGDLGNPNFTQWEAETRSYLASHSDVNVIMWSWCGEVSSATEQDINTYLTLMNGLEEDYPLVRFIYMTGHLDATGLTGNLHIRNEQIRSYCRNNSKTLYDFADIESYNPDGVYFGDLRPNDGCNYDFDGDGTTEFTGDPSTPVNGDRNWAIDWQNSHTVDVDWYNTPVAHTQPVNGNMKAYAAWWMWAMLAGWDGGGTFVPVTEITVTGGSGVITTDNGTLHLTATVAPADATNKSITWSIENGTGQATISTDGLVTAVRNGTVTARATANDGSGISGAIVITISNQIIPVTGITVTGGSGVITTDNGTLQLTATVAPADATNKSITWSIENGTGQATISSEGLVTAVRNGTVTARATANDGSGISGAIVITISNQIIPVTGITVTGGSGVITTDNGTLQLTANVAPADATNKSITWSIENGTGQATISSDGLVTAVHNGTVTVRATANDGSGISGAILISISNQDILVSNITVRTDGGVSEVSTGSSLLFLADVLPADATDKSVTWSVTGITGTAAISEDGLLTAFETGLIRVSATANDGSGVSGFTDITVTNRLVVVTGIIVTSEDGENTITQTRGAIRLLAEVFPYDASIKTVSWSVSGGTGRAVINNEGELTAVSDGYVIAVASATDGSEVTGTLEIKIDQKGAMEVKRFNNEIVVSVAEEFLLSTISIYNYQGCLVAAKTVMENETMFDITGFSPGIYLVTLERRVTLDAEKIIIAF